jgi:hypothetical protein
MSILGNMFSKILGRGHERGMAPPSSTQAQARPAATGQPAGQPTTAPSIPRMDDVDVAKLLDDLAGKSKQKLNWRQSIVDLMKLLGMDSTLAERKELAQELGYTGDKTDSVKMNLWLHQQVLRKLADNGGKVPQDLLH